MDLLYESSTIDWSKSAMLSRIIQHEDNTTSQVCCSTSQHAILLDEGERWCSTHIKDTLFWQSEPKASFTFWHHWKPTEFGGGTYIFLVQYNMYNICMTKLPLNLTYLSKYAKWIRCPSTANINMLWLLRVCVCEDTLYPLYKCGWGLLSGTGVLTSFFQTGDWRRACRCSVFYHPSGKLKQPNCLHISFVVR